MVDDVDLVSVPREGSRDGAMDALAEDGDGVDVGQQGAQEVVLPSAQAAGSQVPAGPLGQSSFSAELPSSQVSVSGPWRSR